MAVKDFFPRAAFMQALGNNRVVVDYLAKLANLVQAIADTASNTANISTLQASLTADEARITTLESEFGDVELLERPGIGLAFALVSSASPSTAAGIIATCIGGIGAGQFGHFYSNAGVNSVQKADGSDPTKPANCFVLAAIADGATGPVTFAGLNSAVTITTPSQAVYLSDTTPGGYMTSAPTTSGHIIQPLGPAIVGQGIWFTPLPTVEL